MQENGVENTEIEKEVENLPTPIRSVEDPRESGPEVQIEYIRVQLVNGSVTDVFPPSERYDWYMITDLLAQAQAVSRSVEKRFVAQMARENQQMSAALQQIGQEQAGQQVVAEQNGRGPKPPKQGRRFIPR